MQPAFVHLRVHSEYSLVDGLVRVKKLVAAVVEDAMPAVAITDQSNLFAMVRFYKAALAAGVKPIIGVDAWIRDPKEAGEPFRLVLLAQTMAGYRNLTRLVSRSYQEGQHLGRAMMERDWFTNASCDGLIALSGGREGDIGRPLLSGDHALAATRLENWLKLFGNRFYIELTRTGRTGEENYIHAAVTLAARHQVPVVATNDTRFLKADEFQAHEVRVCINEGRTLDDPRREHNFSDQQYLRSQAEMGELFADIPEALENSVIIAQRCNIALTLGKNYLPDFPLPEGMSIEAFFSEESAKGLEERLRMILDPDSDDFTERRKPYDERLKIELDVINSMGFPGYFLIVADFIQWSKDNAIPVGPGRGSGAGSLVAYALKITDLDPLEHDLLFERFLNPERVSMPDFDIDFCMEGRDRVIDYVARRYGRDAVSQIITYGTMAAKAVVRDVGRVLGFPYGFTDRIAKLVPFELGMTLSKALEESEELKAAYQHEEEVTGLIDMALSLEGITRNAGKHAGGVVIAPTVLTDFTPLYCEPDGSNLVTQFDKDDVEAVGLVKFDFLGLRTLSIIDWALQTVNQLRKQAGEASIDISQIPMDDKAAFDLLKSAKTTAVFQLESRGMKELVKKLQPDSFDDITALVALYRPGPLQSGMVDDFINRKHGRAEVTYPHPDLEPILAPTYGVILYQEQVMQIAQVLAGYSLGGADLLRRAMGKKKPEEMEKQGKIFRKGAIERGVDEEVAAYIFDLMAKFAGYGFNKSHSAAYALVSYQTMWMKAHYPSAFMAAVLSADLDNTDKVVVLIEECREMRLDVTPPHVNHSQYRFTIGDDKTVIYGLGAIKGVGESAIESIIEARDQGRPYKDLFDFCKRIDARKVNRRVIENLIRAGALDNLDANRATLMAQLPLAIKMAEQHSATQAAGQNDLFGMGGDLDEAPEIAQVVPAVSEEWEDDQRLQGEKETLGLYLTGHPIDKYETELDSIATSRLARLAEENQPQQDQPGYRQKRQVIVAGLVIGTRHIQTQRGAMGSVVLDDRTGRMEVTLFSKVYEEYRDYLQNDKVLVIEGSLSWDDYRGSLSLRAERVMSFEQARAAYAASLTLFCEQDEIDRPPAEWTQALKELLEPFRGGLCALRWHYRHSKARGAWQFSDNWRISPDDELIRRLRRYPGITDVRIIYSRERSGPMAGQVQVPGGE